MILGRRRIDVVAAIRTLMALMFAGAVASNSLAAEAGDRPARGSLSAPGNVTTIVDFETTPLPLTPKASYTSGAAIITDAGFSTAGCTYELVQSGPVEKRGLLVKMPAGFTNGQYCSPGYRFASRATLANREFLSAAVDFGTPSEPAGEGNSPNYAQVRTMLVQYSSGMTYSTKTADLQQYGSIAKSPWMQHLLWRFGGGSTSWTLGGGGAPDGWPNNAQVDGIELRFINLTTTAGLAQQFLVKSIKVQDRGPAIVLFSFDDCRSTTATSSGGLVSAADILTARGIKATAYCASNYVSQGGGLSEAELATLINTHKWDFQIQQTETSGLPGVVFLNAGAGGLTRSGNVCTWVGNPSVPHGYANGEAATIKGAVDSAYLVTAPITQGANNYTFTFMCDAANLAGSVSPAAGAPYAARGGYNEATYKSNLATELAYWRARGFNPRSIGYSTAMVTPEMAKWSVEMGFTYGRGSPINGGAPLAQVFNPQGGAARTMMATPYFGIGNQASAAMIAAVDKAVQYGTVLQFVGHEIADCTGASGDVYTTCDADLAVVADYVQIKERQGLLVDMTANEFVSALQ